MTELTEDDKNSDSQSSKPAQCSVMAASDRWSGGEGRIDWGKEREGGKEGEKGWGQKTASAETESKATSNAHRPPGK